MPTNPYELPSASEDPRSPGEMTEIPGNSWSPASARWALAIVGLSLVPCLCLSSVFLDSDEVVWWAPRSLIYLPLLMILDLILNSPKTEMFLCFSVFLVLFAILSFPLASGRPRIPFRSLVVVFILQALNLVYLAVALFQSIIQQENLGYAITVSGISLGLCCVAVSLAVQCGRRPSFITALAFQGVAWFWLLLYSFPLLFPIVLSV